MTVLQLQCHIEETVDLLQDMGFDGHFIVVFLDQIHLNFRDFRKCVLKPFAGLKTVSTAFSCDDFVPDSLRL